MAKKFDPYEKWFKIPPKEQPPDHYRLLGIERFEGDTSVIDEAAEARAAFLHDVATGPQIALTQRLLNEVATARLCLTDAEKKADYDAQLQQPRKAAKKEIPEATVVQPPTRPKAIPMAQPIPPPQSVPKNEFAVVTNDQVSPAVPARGSVAQRAAASPTKRIQPVWLAAGGGAAVVLVVIVVAIAASSRGPSAANNDDSDEKQTPVAVRDISSGPKQGVKQENQVDDRQGNLADVIKQHNADKADLRRATPNSPLGTFGGNDNPAAWSFGSGLSDPRVVTKGLVLWLDASEKGTVVGGRSIKKWTDKSTSRNDAILPNNKANPPRHKDKLIHGHAAMEFDGGQLLSIKHNDKLNLGANYTIVFVAAGEGILLTKGQADGEQAGAIALQPNLTQLRFGKGSICAAAGDNPNDLKVRIAVANQNSVNWFVDGQSAGEYQGTHEIKNNAALQIGGTTTKGKPRGGFKGKLAELLIYSRPLDDNERQTLEQYLNEKWLK